MWDRSRGLIVIGNAASVWAKRGHSLLYWLISSDFASVIRSHHLGRSKARECSPMLANTRECVPMPFFGAGVDVALMLNAKRPVVSKYHRVSVCFISVIWLREQDLNL